MAHKIGEFERELQSAKPEGMPRGARHAVGWKGGKVRGKVSLSLAATEQQVETYTSRAVLYARPTALVVRVEPPWRPGTILTAKANSVGTRRQIGG